MAERTFTPSSRTNACPICGRGSAGASKKGGDCRLMPDGIWLCHTHTGEGLKPGDKPPSDAAYCFLATSTAAQGFGMWKPSADWEDTNTNNHHRPHRPTPFRIESPAAMAAAAQPTPTLTAKLTRPQDRNTFRFTTWDGTTVKGAKHRTDHGDGRDKEIRWRPALSKENLSTADLAPFGWQDAITHHRQHGGPVLISKGELKVLWCQDIGLQAISIHEWNDRLAQELLALGRDAVLVPDCDLADLQGWYTSACQALPQARHLFTPGADWADPPKKRGIGLDDWLQTNLESVSSTTATDLLAGVTDQPWQLADEPQEEKPPTYRELLRHCLNAIRSRDIDTEMLCRAQLKHSFRISDEQINTALFKEHGAEKLEGVKPTHDSVRLEAIEQLNYQLPGWAPKGDLSLLYGPFGAGKTTLAVAMLRAYVTGQGLLDRPASYTPGRGLFIATDSGAAALKKSMRDLGIDPDDDPLFSPGHPDQRVWIWAHEPKQGQEAWIGDIHGVIRLEEFIKEKKIGLVMIDSAKAISAPAGWSYTSNESVKALLQYLREGIAAPLETSLCFLSHDGTLKGSHAGAKAWAEDPSMVISLSEVKDENGRTTGITASVLKDRAAVSGVDARRDVTYSLVDEQLQLHPEVEVVKNCPDALLTILWEAHQRGVESVSTAGIQDEAMQRFGLASKTVRNTLGQIAGSGKGASPTPVIRLKRGFYSLTPAEIQKRLAVSFSSSSNRDLYEEGQKDLRSIAAAGEFLCPNACPDDFFGTNASTPDANVPEDPSGQALGHCKNTVPDSVSLESCPNGEVPITRATPSQAPASPLAEAHKPPAPPDGVWLPVRFGTDRRGEHPQNVNVGDWVRPISSHLPAHHLAAITSNGSWQDTDGQIVPIGPDWFVLQQRRHPHR